MNLGDDEDLGSLIGCELHNVLKTKMKFQTLKVVMKKMEVRCRLTQPIISTLGKQRQEDWVGSYSRLVSEILSQGKGWGKNKGKG